MATRARQAVDLTGFGDVYETRGLRPARRSNSFWRMCRVLI